MRLSQSFLVPLVLAILTVAAGCGEGQFTTVQAAVTVNGQPLESGVLSLTPVSGQGAAAGGEIHQGQCEIRAAGLTAGEYKVSISAFRRTGKKTWDGMGDENAPASQKRYVEDTEQYLPAKYNDSTELTAALASGKVNPLKLDLQVAPPRK